VDSFEEPSPRHDAATSAAPTPRTASPDLLMREGDKLVLPSTPPR
jgi:hypothetical protein